MSAARRAVGDADGTAEFVAECLWPGVRESDIRVLDERAAGCAARTGVRYLGSLLMVEDEVVLCLFRGQREAVSQIAREAQIPFDRILEASCTGWPLEHVGTNSPV